MVDLNTVFKQVFGEGLRGQGFVKIKGRQPYLVRVIEGGEILQVITINNEWCGERGFKSFSILGTVITLYRKKIDFSISPYNNVNIFYDLSEFYFNENPMGCNYTYKNDLASFIYKADEETAMYNAMNNALEKTSEIMIPIFDKIVDLEACIDYFLRFGRISMIPSQYEEERGDFGCGSDEGLLYIKTNNHDDFIEETEKRFSEYIELLRSGNAQFSIDIARKDFEEGRDERRMARDDIYNDPYLYEKALEELERRRVDNTEALRLLGLEI